MKTRTPNGPARRRAAHASAARTAAAAALILLGASPAFADPAVGERTTAPTRVETVTVHTVEMRGKPPYRRTREEVPVTEIARFEIEDRATAPDQEDDGLVRRRLPLPLRMK